MNGGGSGAEMHRLIRELFPICRSITGDGFRRTLGVIARHIPLEIHEVPTGAKFFDWTVPREWNIRDAWVKNARGERVIDFRESNLHVVSYSTPVRATMSLDELRPHLHSLPEHPAWIPYRTSYYQESWGFCLQHERLLALPEGTYDVCIDSTLQDGHLVYGEHFVRGATEDEVLISCHACHPSLANDNLSGVSLATFLAKIIAVNPGRLSYRFLFIPATIGAIVWLARNQAHTGRIKHGLVVACVGDSGEPTYKKSRSGGADIDRAVLHVLRHRGGDYRIRDFSPLGYDERQYCSPGFDLPVGSLTRTPNGCYAQYHTSADDLEFVRPDSLADSLALYRSVITVLENNRRYVRTNPHGEPQLGKRGLLGALGGAGDRPAVEEAILWTLNLADGRHRMLDIAERSGLPFDQLTAAAQLLLDHGLLREEG